MPRQGRLDAPGALHHVIQRGIAGERIFGGQGDYRAFVHRLGVLLGQTGTSCFAWALLPNHFHLLLRTGDVPVGRMMQRLLTWYAGYYNREHRRNGHLFQNRFKSIVCEEDRYFMALVRYIHLNPVRAGLVKDLGRLAQYEWCGDGVLAGVLAHGWQDVDEVSRRFGRTRRVAWTNYRRFLREGLDKAEEENLEGGGAVRSMGGVFEYLSARKKGKDQPGDERVLGSERFVDRVLKEAERREGRRSRLRRSGWSVSRVLDRVGRIFGLDQAGMRGGGKTDVRCQARRLACHWLVNELGYTAAEVASALEITGAAVTVNAPLGRELAEKRRLSLEG